VPAGYQEADLEMAEMMADSARLAQMRRRGICSHSWMLGTGNNVNYSGDEIAEMRTRGYFSDRPTDPRIGCQNDIPLDQRLCLDCGELVDDPLVRR
jgi:hypothetical protein